MAFKTKLETTRKKNEFLDLLKFKYPYIKFKGTIDVVESYINIEIYTDINETIQREIDQFCFDNQIFQGNDCPKNKKGYADYIDSIIVPNKKDKGVLDDLFI